MAKQNKVAASRKTSAQSRGAESLSMRSATTLGRVIGSLHRQIDGALERVTAGSTRKRVKRITDDDVPRRPARRKTTRTASAASRPK
jgi:hypothetical protein